MSCWEAKARAAFLTLIVATASANDVRATNADLNTPPTLDKLVEAFFRSQDAEERASLTSAIEEAANGSVEAVAEAVRAARLWSPLPDARGSFSLKSAAGGTIEVAYHLPAGYDPGNRYPMIVCMPDRGASPADTITRAREALGESVREFVLIGPTQPVGGAFHQPAAAAADLRRLIWRARRQIHVDADRVFLLGFRAGGEAAWIEAIAHADLFAGVITLSAYPPAPYPEQVYPFLLENLRQLPVLTVWSSADGPRATTRQRSVAAHNRAVVQFAKQASLPIVGLERDVGRVDRPDLDKHTRGIAGSGDPTYPLKPPSDEVSRMLARRRPSHAGTVSHWFRYPGQGHAGWLRQTRFTGNVWEANQLSILTSPTTDRDRFVAGVVKDKLAYLGGRIEGQTITIQTRRCARIDLLLREGVVDLDRPITVRCNGKQRYHGRVRRSIRTLLATAYEQWEFQRLTVARLSFSIRSNAISG